MVIFGIICLLAIFESVLVNWRLHGGDAMTIGSFEMLMLMASSSQAVPAMSRWIQGVSSENSLRNIAAVTAPPPLPLPTF